MPEKHVLDNRTKIFFAIFFTAILSSVAVTFDNIYLRHNYATFTEENEPEALDAYTSLYEWIQNALVDSQS